MAKRLRDKQFILCVSDTEREMIRHRMELCKEKNMGRYIRRKEINDVKEMLYAIWQIQKIILSDESNLR